MRALTKIGLILCGLVAVAGLGVDKAAAHSSVFVGVGVGAPIYPYYYRPYYGWPPPVAYVPPPVIYSPPPVIYAPPPVVYQQQPAQSWYYCGNPQGYYPHVSTCNTGWRQVPAAPVQ